MLNNYFVKNKLGFVYSVTSFRNIDDISRNILKYAIVIALRWNQRNQRIIALIDTSRYLWRILWQWKPWVNYQCLLIRVIMHECLYFSRFHEILVNLQLVFVDLLNFGGKQMQFAFVLFWRVCAFCILWVWPDFDALVAKAQTRVATLMFGLLVWWKESQLVQASGNTDLTRGAWLQRGHVNVVITKMSMTEKISLKLDLHK